MKWNVLDCSHNTLFTILINVLIQLILDNVSLLNLHYEQNYEKPLTSKLLLVKFKLKS